MVVKTDSETPNFVELYKEARKNSAFEEYYLIRFKFIRDKYSNELPERDVRELIGIDDKGNFEQKRYKCRGNSIVGLCLALNGVVKDKVVTDSELVIKIDGFTNYNFSYKYGKFTTIEEINMINQILSDVVTHLEEITQSRL